MDVLVLVIFLVSSGVTVYIYFGYPLLLLMMSKLRPRPIERDETVPSMSLIIPLFNEEGVVERKILNSLALDYPAEILEVLFVSDGSTDATEEIVQRIEDARIRLITLPRGGKAAALNSGAAAARGDVLVFTDANVELYPDALRVMARCFADPKIGGVAGRKKQVVRHGTDTTEQGENLYWRYDQWQKQLESAIGSVFAADGTLYAVRRSLYVPIDDPAQADDIAISTRVVLQGYRLVFDRDAVAVEEAPGDGADEFRRKVRVTNHSVRALLGLGRPLWTSGFYSVQLLSHKLIRHLIPFFLLLILLSTLYLAFGRLLFRLVLLLQIVFYLLALSGTLLRRRKSGALKFLSVPYYFCLVNAAAFLGVLSIVRGKRVRTWAPRGT